MDDVRIVLPSKMSAVFVDELRPFLSTEQQPGAWTIGHDWR
jgi:hypothetical protein